MTRPYLKFGTDGWRAIIADGFTFSNLELVTRATVGWLKKQNGGRVRIVIGHDTRFMGREFSEFCARIFAENDIHVLFAGSITPTPAISWATQAFDCDAGIVITASHNPPQYNGFKIKASFGGPASPEMIAAVERELDSVELGEQKPRSFSDYEREGVITLRDIKGEYTEMLRTRLDIGAIQASGIRIAHDAMYGAGMGIISDLVGSDRIVEIRSEWNPGFHGRAPEPIERNLKMLSRTVVENACAVGIANDGDADRVGMYDERGIFVDSHQMLSLLVKYLHKARGMSGHIVKTFSTTHLLDKMADAYNLKVHTTPIGFKYIAAKITEEDILVGGEESGGMAVKGHIPERDGIYIGLLIVEMMVKRGMKLSELVQGLYDEFGPHVNRRTDVHTTNEKMQHVLEMLRAGELKELDGQPITEVQTLDGFKHFTEGGWLLVRPSGTEPVLRIYSEAESALTATGLIEDAIRQLGV